MTKAKRVLSTPRRTAFKIKAKKRTDKANLFGTPPTSHLVVLGDDRPAASLPRAEQIIELLSTCYVREGWKIDKAAAKRALAFVRGYAKDGSDPDAGRKAAIDFFHTHGQSLDWVLCGDIRGMICGLASHSERAKILAASPAVDPIFAALDAFRCAEAKFYAERSGDIPHEIGRRWSKAVDVVIRTQPTTPAGLGALTGFARDMAERSDRGDAGLPDGGWVPVVAAIDDAAKALIWRPA
jgi:hypothetical protein